MPRKILLPILLLLLILGCAKQTVSSRDVYSAGEPMIEVSLSCDAEQYPKLMGRTVYPTYAVWVTAKQRGMVRTIFATGKLGADEWTFASARPSASPVWAGIHRRELMQVPDLAVDGISAATPKSETFIVRWTIPEELRDKHLQFYLEANLAFDYNEHFPKGAKEGETGYNMYNGQPSLIWNTQIYTGHEPQEGLVPKLIGHGHVLGDDDKLNPDLSEITTARDIFKRIEVSYIPSAEE